jgi:hypothetical protein
MPKQTNIYDLVERAAARRSIPRLELWQEATKALVTRELPAKNLSVFVDWLIGFLGSVERFNDPNGGGRARILKNIIVRARDFDKWLYKKSRGRRGPVGGTTGLQVSDRKIFPSIENLIASGKAFSAYGAALKLHKDIAGTGSPENKAKRVSARYRKEHL